jgi:hypothetical protein
MTPMAEQILKIVTERRTVTFVELQNSIAGFGGGDKEISLNGDGYSNIVLWGGLTDAAVAALEELRVSRAIHPIPAAPLTYLIDGAMMRMPVAKSKRHYKKPHWAPVVFNPGADPKSKAVV